RRLCILSVSDRLARSACLSHDLITSRIDLLARTRPSVDAQIIPDEQQGRGDPAGWPFPEGVRLRERGGGVRRLLLSALEQGGHARPELHVAAFVHALHFPARLLGRPRGQQELGRLSSGPASIPKSLLRAAGAAQPRLIVWRIRFSRSDRTLSWPVTRSAWPLMPSLTRPWNSPRPTSSLSRAIRTK